MDYRRRAYLLVVFDDIFVCYVAALVFAVSHRALAEAGFLENVQRGAELVVRDEEEPLRPALYCVVPAFRKDGAARARSRVLARRAHLAHLPFAAACGLRHARREHLFVLDGKEYHRALRDEFVYMLEGLDVVGLDFSEKLGYPLGVEVDESLPVFVLEFYDFRGAPSAPRSLVRLKNKTFDTKKDAYAKRKRLNS